MQLKTENNQIWIGFDEREAGWINEEIESVDTDNLGFVGLNDLKNTIYAGIYIDK